MSSTSQDKEIWSRPHPEVAGPTRLAGGLYRMAQTARADNQSVPLTDAEDAVVAAVRMAYGVASAQVERSTRLARRLREAGDPATGGRSDRKAIDAAEQLVFRTLMSGLVWLEGLAAEGDSPLKRLVLAQYRLLGSTLGIDSSEAAAARERPPPAAPGQPETVARQWLDALRAPVAAPASPPPDLTVGFRGGTRRPVRDNRFSMTRKAHQEGEIEIELYSRTSPEPLKAFLNIEDPAHATIWLTIEPDTKPGWWTAAVCEDNLQIGIVEIEL